MFQLLSHFSAPLSRLIPQKTVYMGTLHRLPSRSGLTPPLHHNTFIKVTDDLCVAKCNGQVSLLSLFELGSFLHLAPRALLPLSLHLVFPFFFFSTSKNYRAPGFSPWTSSPSKLYPIVDLIQPHGYKHHLCANKSQIYISSLVHSRLQRDSFLDIQQSS